MNNSIDDLDCEANAFIPEMTIAPKAPDVVLHAYKLNHLTNMLKMNCEPVNVQSAAKLLSEIDAELTALKQKIVKFF